MSESKSSANSGVFDESQVVPPLPDNQQMNLRDHPIAYYVCPTDDNGRHNSRDGIHCEQCGFCFKSENFCEWGMNGQFLCGTCDSPGPGAPKRLKQFTVKDSGERRKFESGMVRDIDDEKPNIALVYDGPMLKRWAVHITKGAVKYAKRNWMQARGDSELERFKESAARHFQQWMDGELDEDHAAAVFFNINGAEYVREKMAENEQAS